MTILLLTKFSYCQESESELIATGFYTKVSASIAMPAQIVNATFGYGFNRHFALGVGVGAMTFWGYCFYVPVSIDISGDIARLSKTKDLALFYSIEPMLLLGNNVIPYIQPKIGIKTKNLYVSLTYLGINISYKFQFYQ